MSEHTPTPWWAGHYSSIVGLPIAAQPDPKKNSIILCGVRGDRLEAEANAAFIVRAVNSHDAIVKAMNGLLDRYTGLVNCGDCGFWDPETEDEVIAARAALAEVKK